MDRSLAPVSGPRQNMANNRFRPLVEVFMSDHDLHEQVIEIVRRVLRIESIDPTADFFDLGASSSQLLQIVELVETECARNASIIDIFEATDIDAFAQIIVKAEPLVRE
jgi:acyl carrier protein